jgi:hypothetical protein
MLNQGYTSSQEKLVPGHPRGALHPFNQTQLEGGGDPGAPEDGAALSCE